MPEEIHQQVARRLAEKAAPQTPSLDAAAPSRRDIASAQEISQRPRRIPETPTERRADNFSSPALAPGSYAEVDRLLPLRSLAVSDLEQRLIALFGRRLRALQREGHETLLLPIDEQRALEFQLDRGRNLVLVRGPARWSSNSVNWSRHSTAAAARGRGPRRCVLNERLRRNYRRLWMRIEVVLPGPLRPGPPIATNRITHVLAVAFDW